MDLLFEQTCSTLDFDRLVDATMASVLRNVYSEPLMNFTIFVSSIRNLTNPTPQIIRANKIAPMTLCIIPLLRSSGIANNVEASQESHSGGSNRVRWLRCVGHNTYGSQ